MKKTIFLFAVIAASIAALASPVRGDTAAKAISDQPPAENIVPIEYLESTGTQWIDTGIPGNTPNLWAEGEFTWTSKVDYGCFFGNYIGEDYNAFRMIFVQGTGLSVYATSGGKASVSHANYNHFAPRYWHNIVLDSRSHTFVVDGVDYPQVYREGYDNPLNVGIFAYVTGGAAGGTKRIAWFRMYAGDELIRDLIPVRIGNEGFLLDLNSNALFANQGAGDFILGPDLEPLEL